MDIVTQRDHAVYTQAGFNYESLTPEVRTDVQESTRRIHELERRTSESIIEIGQQLIRVKQRLPHGEFLPWLDAEFGWSQQTASNFMRVADVFGGDKLPNFSNFQPSALYALASNNVPQEVRDDFAAVAEAGNKVTHSDVKSAISEYKSGQTTNLRDLAEEHGIDLDDEDDEDVSDGDDAPPFEEVDPSDPATFLEPMQPLPERQSDPVPAPAPTPHVSHNSGENEWYTPVQYIEAAREVMGDIDLDPASSDIANQTVNATTYYTKHDNGLVKPWYGRVWMNPPYAQPLIQFFAEKVADEFKEENISEAIVLVNNATETKAWQYMARVATAVCFPRGRIRYLDATGKPANTPLQGQSFIYFGRNVEAFERVFQQFGEVL